MEEPIEWSYTQTVSEASQNLEIMVVRRDPRHPAEERERLKEIIGEPEVDEHCPESPEEELVSTHAVEPLEGAWHSNIVVVVER
jgi:hypothetical protein